MLLNKESIGELPGVVDGLGKEIMQNVMMERFHFSYWNVEE